VQANKPSGHEAMPADKRSQPVIQQRQQQGTMPAEDRLQLNHQA
jgi:hypothetical protein